MKIFYPLQIFCITSIIKHVGIPLGVFNTYFRILFVVSYSSSKCPLKEAPFNFCTSLLKKPLHLLSQGSSTLEIRTVSWIMLWITDVHLSVGTCWHVGAGKGRKHWGRQGRTRISEKAAGRTEGKASHASTWSPEGSRDMLSIPPSQAFLQDLIHSDVSSFKCCCHVGPTLMTSSASMTKGTLRLWCPRLYIFIILL